MDNSFLGTGFSLRPDDKQDPHDAVKKGLYTILMTRQGERVMRPDFGSRIWDYLFETSSQSTKQMIATEILQCIRRWENRVDDVKVDVDTGTTEGL